MSLPYEPTEEQRDELVEQVAREIQLRGLFGGEFAGASEILADDAGIEQLIMRLEELDEESTWDA